MQSRKLCITNIAQKLAGQRVLMRVDFNVPLQEGKVVNNKKIRETINTINFALENQAKSVVLMSHLGRPNGNPNAKFSLKPVAGELSKLLGRKVNFVDSCVGGKAESETQNPSQGSVFLLENLRFHPEEEGSLKKPDGTKVQADKSKVAEFRKSLAKHGDVYINDAFGTVHRAHSSIIGIDLQVKAAGLLLIKELKYFNKALENPERPMIVILGGAKVADKIQLIMSLLDKCNEMIIGGGMAYTFKRVLHNTNIGKSLFDKAGSLIVKDIMKKAEEKNVKIHLPEDFQFGDKFAKGCQVKTGPQIDDNWSGFDIGPKTAEKFAKIIEQGKTTI